MVNNARMKLKNAIRKAQGAPNPHLPSGVLMSNQEPEEGNFSRNILNKNELLKPPYDPDKLWRIVENSQILPQCIDAKVKNVHGFGYDFSYTGDEEESSLPEEILNEKRNAIEFFKMVNEDQSFTSLSMDLQEDFEKTGNAYMEVIRDIDGGISLLYRADCRRVRLQKVCSELVPIKVMMYRNGKDREITIFRRFRRYVMTNGKNGQRVNLVWFKEFGDPRRMCRVTGDYEDELETGQEIIDEASEIIHFKLGNGTYGVPRWSGQILITMGMQSAEFVNYDLFDNQVVPPLAILVSGGSLSDESLNDIEDVLLQKKGVGNFNKVLILETRSDGTVTEKDTAKIELTEMSQARKEDAMFTSYTEKGEGKIRTSFRLPPIKILSRFTQ